MTSTTPQNAITIYNDSGEYIPPRSVVVVTSVQTVVDVDETGATQETVAYHFVNKYNCGVKGNVFVTGPSGIASGKAGLAFADQLIHVAIDTSIAVPVAGEEWGPYDGSFTITRGGKGFFAQGYFATDGLIDTAIFLRTFVREAPSICSSSSSSASSSGSRSSASGSSGSSSSSSPCGSITVVTNVTCSGGSLVVTYGEAAASCPGQYVYTGQQYSDAFTGDYLEIIR